MEDTLISFETAKLAKSKGFTVIIDKDQEHLFKFITSTPANCDTFYNKEGVLFKIEFPGEEDLGSYIFDMNSYNNITLCPTQSLLQKWLRDIHNIHCFIGFRPNTKKWDSHAYNLKLNGVEYGRERPIRKYFNAITYDNYEEALEAAIVEGLNNIQI